MLKSFISVCTHLVEGRGSNPALTLCFFPQQPGSCMTWYLLLSQGLCEPLYTCSSPWHRPQPGGRHNQSWRAQPPGRECPSLFGEVTTAHNVYNTSELKSCRLQQWCVEFAAHCDLSTAAFAGQSLMLRMLKYLQEFLS